MWLFTCRPGQIGALLLFFFRGRLACAPCMCTLASFFKQDCILLGAVASKKSSAYHGSLADALVFTQTLACIKYYLGRTNIMCHGTPFPVFFQTQWGHCVCFLPEVLACCEGSPPPALWVSFLFMPQHSWLHLFLSEHESSCKLAFSSTLNLLLSFHQNDRLGSELRKAWLIPWRLRGLTPSLQQVNSELAV